MGSGLSTAKLSFSEQFKRLKQAWAKHYKHENKLKTLDNEHKEAAKNNADANVIQQIVDDKAQHNQHSSAALREASLAKAAIEKEHGDETAAQANKDAQEQAKKDAASAASVGVDSAMPALNFT